MRFRAVALVILAATPVGAFEITADMVIAAWRLGAPAEVLAARIADPANTCARLTPGDVERMREAGVPATAVHALQTRLAPTSPPPAAPVTAAAPTADPTPVAARSSVLPVVPPSVRPTLPDLGTTSVAAPPAPRLGVPQPPIAPAATPSDPRMTDIARMVASGLPDGDVIAHLRRDPVPYRPTTDDLVFLTSQHVPLAVIAALIPASPAPVAAVSTPTPLREVDFDRLAVTRGGYMKMTRPGVVTVTGNRLVWTDATEPSLGFAVVAKEIRKLWPRCDPRPHGKVCNEVYVQPVHGDGFTLRDLEFGGGRVPALLEVLITRFPAIEVEERTTR